MGPSSKIWASRNNSGIGRINGSGLARAVGVYGRLRDLREPEVPGRANDGATTATDVVLEREHQSGRAVCVDACESLFSIAPESGPLRFEIRSSRRPEPVWYFSKIPNVVLNSIVTRESQFFPRRNPRNPTPSRNPS